MPENHTIGKPASDKVSILNRARFGESLSRKGATDQRFWSHNSPLGEEAARPRVVLQRGISMKIMHGLIYLVRIFLWLDYPISNDLF